MASIKDAKQLVEGLSQRVAELEQEVNGDMDFSAVVKLSDAIGEAADQVAVTFQRVNDAFEQQGNGENGNGGSITEALSPGSRAQDGAESLSREDLYERARKADIPGRSEMSKDELVRALKKAGEKIG